MDRTLLSEAGAAIPFPLCLFVPHLLRTPAFRFTASVPLTAQPRCRFAHTPASAVYSSQLNATQCNHYVISRQAVGDRTSQADYLRLATDGLALAPAGDAAAKAAALQVR